MQNWMKISHEVSKYDFHSCIFFLTKGQYVIMLGIPMLKCRYYGVCIRPISHSTVVLCIYI